MAHKDVEKELEYYKKVNESLVDGINKLQGEIQALKVLNRMLMNEKQQWLAQKIIQENIIQEALNRSNALNQEHQEEIQRLREKLNKNNNNVVVHSVD